MSSTSGAVSLLTSPKAREAFDLSKEPESLRRRYGQHCWGQRALMARRLVEAGCSFVTMVYENPYQSGVERLKQGVYNWDSHAVNCHLYDDGKVRLPIYDQAVTALVEDLYARGLDKKVLLIVTGEFGRTPRINSQTGTQTGVKQPGRDHWPNAMSLLVAGGGMRTGQVIGSTTAKGEVPKDRPLTPNDLWATMYRHLGINPQWSFPDHNGRPMPNFAVRGTDCGIASGELIDCGSGRRRQTFAIERTNHDDPPRFSDAFCSRGHCRIHGRLVSSSLRRQREGAADRADRLRGAGAKPPRVVQHSLGRSGCRGLRSRQFAAR